MRSLYERTGEHMADRIAKKEESHQIKHWLLEHQDMEEPPRFKFRLIKTFKDPMSRQLAEAVRIELRGNNILNSKAEYNRSRVPRLRVDMEGWKKATEKEPTSLQEVPGEEEYEATIVEVEKAKKRKPEEETDMKQKKKPKRIKMDKLEGWGENGEDNEDENLPEGWWETVEQQDNSRIIEEDTTPLKRKRDEEEGFKFKKRGRLNKAEEKELKRTCKSILNWVKVPAIPALPTPSPSINSVNITQEEEAYEMEWEEVWRGERVEKARSRKEKWEVARTVVTEIVEKATTESENGHVIQLLNETLQAGWKRIEEKEEKKKKAKEKKEEWEIKRIAIQITTGVVEDAVSRSEMKHIENIVEDTLHEGWRRRQTLPATPNFPR